MSFAICLESSLSDDDDDGGGGGTRSASDVDGCRDRRRLPCDCACSSPVAAQLKRKMNP